MSATMRPEPSECAPYYRDYVNAVPEGHIIDILEQQLSDTLLLLGDLSPERPDFRYADGKWSLKEVVGHVVDCERVFATRALAFSRGDPAEMPGFEQDDYVAHGGFGERPFPNLLAEYEALRMANLALFQGFSDEMMLRSGVANGSRFTVRALVYIVAGHERHHMQVIRERYL